MFEFLTSPFISSKPQNTQTSTPLFIPQKKKTLTPAQKAPTPFQALSNLFVPIREAINPPRSKIVENIQQEKQMTLTPEAARKAVSEFDVSRGVVRIPGSDTVVDPIFTGSLKNVGNQVVRDVVPRVFKGFKDYTTKFLEYSKGKSTLSRQEILDFARRPELKKGEADLLNKLAKDLPEGKLPVQEFADSIRRDLLELKPVKVYNPQYTGTTVDRTRQLGPEMYGKNAKGGFNYEEVVFESPITTNGSSHFPNSKNYFAHARGDEVVESGKKIWREQEIQSDLLQKDRLDDVFRIKGDKWRKTPEEFMQGDARLSRADAEQLAREIAERNAKRLPELEKLEPFTNDRFGERIMRERIREKAGKGYEKYRLPTGETIGKIEGFQGMNRFNIPNPGGPPIIASVDNIKIGQEIVSPTRDSWIITDILGDGRFKAVDKKVWDVKDTIGTNNMTKERWQYAVDRLTETFDLTGKSNPQYRRYSDWGKFLKNKYGGKLVTDLQGNSWIEIDLKGEMGRMPIEAFAAAPLLSFPLTEKESPTATTTTGVQLREVPESWQEHINEAYENHPALKKYKGLIEAILMQESSMGTIDKNYNPSIGESAWLGGATESLKKELDRKGIKYNLDTQKGLINAIASYLDVKRMVLNPGSTKAIEYKDPVNLYLQRYKTREGKELTPKQIQQFREYINYYKNG